MPATMPSISVREVSKSYRIFPKERDRLKEALSFGRKNYGHDFWALRDVNLQVEPGTTLGILGRNGAGKSTLLNVISGVAQPTSGAADVNGRLIAVSSVGAMGFNPDYTGRENILLTA
jgi:ABC-type polysaccharide/polyol phosphate transport system ATPase subunit